MVQASKGLLRDLFEELRSGDVESLERRRAHCLEVTLPIDGRTGERRQLGFGHDVVALVGIAQGNAVDRGGSQRGFELEHGFGLGSSHIGGIAGELEHVGDVLDVPIAGLYRLWIGLQVVIAIGKRKAALVQGGNGFGGVLGVGLGAEQEQRRHADVLEAHQFGQQRGTIADRVDAVQLRSEGFNTFLSDGGRVHAGGVGIADLLLELAATGPFGGRALQDIEQHFFIAVADLGEAGEAGAVGRQGIVGNPVAAGVLVKIDARVDRLVHGSRIRAGGRSAPIRGQGQHGNDQKRYKRRKFHSRSKRKIDSNARRWKIGGLALTRSSTAKSLRHHS